MPDDVLTDLPPHVSFRRSERAIDAEVGGMTVMLDAEVGNYFGLNEAGTRIWSLLAEPHSPAQIVDDLVAHFEVTRDVADDATRTFLADLESRGLVERVS